MTASDTAPEMIGRYAVYDEIASGGMATIHLGRLLGPIGFSRTVAIKLDITAMAANLNGKLMIVYGDMDENVPQSQALRLVDALIKANKPYDLLYLPNRTHRGGYEGYVVQRRFDYFVEHLLGVAPPADVVFGNPPTPSLH